MKLPLSDLEIKINELKANIRPSLYLSCGVVFRAALKEKILGYLQPAENSSSHRCLLDSLPVYFDEKQTVDCLVFDDRDMMSAYLNRHADPMAWIKLCMASEGTSLETEAFKPILPEIPKATSSFLNYYDPTYGLG